MQQSVRSLFARAAAAVPPRLLREATEGTPPILHIKPRYAPHIQQSLKFCTHSTPKGVLSEPVPSSSAENPEFGQVDLIALRGDRYSGNPWSASEDTRLRDAVAEFGLDWAKVAEHVGNGRTNRGCRQRWLLRLQESIIKRPFTKAEIARILKLMDQYPRQWTKVAELLGTGHSADQIRHFAVRRADNADIYRSWSREEDELLRVAVERHGAGRWAAVAEMVPGRDDASCYSRWTFSLDPTLVRGPWSEAEDRRLLAAVEALKKSGEPFHFGDVAILLRSGRHRKACRSRYKRLMAKKEEPVQAKEKSY